MRGWLSPGISNSWDVHVPGSPELALRWSFPLGGVDCDVVGTEVAYTTVGWEREISTPVKSSPVGASSRWVLSNVLPPSCEATRYELMLELAVPTMAITNEGSAGDAKMSRIT